MLDINKTLLEEINKYPSEFKVARKVPWSLERGVPKLTPASNTYVVFLDLETTGLNYKEHELIELALVKCSISSTGFISPVDFYSHLQQPSTPINECGDAAKANGITNVMVEGQTIIPKDIYEFLEGVTYIVSHNATFDRPFFHKYFPNAPHMKWGCSYKDLPWKSLGQNKCSLDQLLLLDNYTFEVHRALNDAGALAFLFQINIELFKDLLHNINQDKYRVLAWEAPFSVKDTLKECGYTWNAPVRNVWSKDIYKDEIDRETDMLIALYPNAEDDGEIIKLDDSFKRYLPQE